MTAASITNDNVPVRVSTGLQQAICVILGALVLRGMTTSLYWFSSPRVYDCVKFHLHNQRRQQEPSGWYSLMDRWYPRQCVPQVEMVVFLVACVLLAHTVDEWNEVLFQGLFGSAATNHVLTNLTCNVVTMVLALVALCHGGGF